jgi:transcription elongation factor Elf1
VWAEWRIQAMGRCADIAGVEMDLCLTCPQCGAEFRSAIQMDKETWTKIKVEHNIERCSACGFSKRYQKSDYFFR